MPEGAVSPGADVGTRLTRLETEFPHLKDALDQIKDGIQRIRDGMDALQRLEQQHLDVKAAQDRAFAALSKQTGRIDDLQLDLANKMGWVKGVWFAVMMFGGVAGAVAWAAGGYVLNRTVEMEGRLAHATQEITLLQNRVAVMEAGTAFPRNRNPAVP